ncbi:DNA cross-link repair 1A protein-like isoform X2 [Periplaneta americana]|uniref:DNA cross-link repair 1A protein-like isoform X2 n=1 Tax=Periplaneta americana TaxID=6978 RepID=UPI0037E87651
MEDLYDDFLVSVSGVPKKEEIATTLSQQSSISRLSRSYFLSKKRRETDSCISIDIPCTSSTIETPKNSRNLNHQPNTSELKFCPNCQVPFYILKVDPKVHASQCSVISYELKECPEGKLCHSTNLHHYRDYAHSLLAQIRSSVSNTEPDPFDCSSSKKSHSSDNESNPFKSPRTSFRKKKVKTIRPSKNINEFTQKKILFPGEYSPEKDDSTKLKLTLKNRLFPTEYVPGKDDSTKLKLTLKQRLLSEGCFPEEDDSAKPNNNDGDSNDSVCDPIEGTEIFNKTAESFHLKSRNDIKTNEKCIMKTSTSTYNAKQNVLLTQNSNKDVHENVIEHETIEQEISIIPDESNDTSKNNFKDHTCNHNCDHNCSNKLKLNARVEYASDKPCGEKTVVKKCALPCSVDEVTRTDCESAEVKAVMSVVLTPSKQDPNIVEDKLKTPVKIDAKCNELGWETVQIAAMPDAEVSDVQVSLCKCTKTMHLSCCVSQDKVSETCVDKNNEVDLQPKFCTNVQDFDTSNKHCNQKKVSKVQNHHMSITSYFRSQSKIPIESAVKDVESGSSCVVVPQDKNNFTSDSQTTVRMENSTNTSLEPGKSREAVVAHWKQILRGMSQKGQSTMSVMSDDSLALSSDCQTSVRSSESSQQYSGKKTCPYYKKIPDTSFVVDAFQYGIIPGVTHYFLSHFHSDHYGGLKKSFSKPIFCSRITAALVMMKLRVDEKYLHVLELDNPKKIHGVLVTALDANHCPGSVMFLFQLPDGRNFLHVGDFRANPIMESYPQFWNLTIDKLYLDTTYCEPRYTFPLQSETILRVMDLATEHKSKAPATLFVSGTYTIGKEKVFLGIAEALDCKIWAHPEKRKVLDCINNPLINERLTTKQWEAQVHVCRMTDVNRNMNERRVPRRALEMKVKGVRTLGRPRTILVFLKDGT